MKRAFILALVACTGGRTGLGTHTEADGSLGGRVDSGSTTCGNTSCDSARQYCKIVSGGPPPGIHREDCTALPGGCHGCSCISFDRSCKCTETNGIRVSCAVP